MFKNQAQQTAAMEEIKGIGKTLEKLVGVQSGILDVIKATLSWRVIADMEARMTESKSHRRARDLLRSNCLDVPAEKEDRDALRDYASFLSQLSGAVTESVVTPATAAEKYGADTERVLANPYMQDQLLGNAARWTSVVVLGRALLAVRPASPGDAEPLETPCRKEARKFLDAYDAEAARCAKVVKAALASRMSETQSVDTPTSWHPVCGYTRARLESDAR